MNMLESLRSANPDLSLFSVLDPEFARYGRVLPCDDPAALSAALGGLAQTGIYFFYYRNLRTHEVWVVKLWLLLMPVVSCFIGVIFLRETLTPWKLLGIAVVLLGAGLILLRDRLHKQKEIQKNG